MLNAAETQKFQEVIERRLPVLFQQLYPGYNEQYWNYRNKIGPHCPMCKAAARFIYIHEVKRKGQEFIQRFKSSEWEDYS